MSGLFNRLAAEALGAARPNVHPVARMRNVPSPELVELPGRASALEEPMRPGLETEEASPSSTEGQRTPISRHEGDPREPMSPRNGPNASGAAARPGAGVGEDPGDGRVSPPPPEIVLQDSSPAETPERAHEEIDMHASPGDPLTAVARQRLRKPPRTPTALIWHGADPAHPGWRQSDLVDRVSEAARRTGGEPSEVHVHIDRIEVTAVKEAPPPPTPRPERRKPMSLDEYLAKRAGRSP